MHRSSSSSASTASSTSIGTTISMVTKSHQKTTHSSSRSLMGSMSTQMTSTRTLSVYSFDYPDDFDTARDRKTPSLGYVSDRDTHKSAILYRDNCKQMGNTAFKNILQESLRGLEAEFDSETLLNIFLLTTSSFSPRPLRHRHKKKLSSSWDSQKNTVEQRLQRIDHRRALARCRRARRDLLCDDDPSPEETKHLLLDMHPQPSHHQKDDISMGHEQQNNKAHDRLDTSRGGSTTRASLRNSNSSSKMPGQVALGRNFDLALNIVKHQQAVLDSIMSRSGNDGSCSRNANDSLSRRQNAPKGYSSVSTRLHCCR